MHPGETSERGVRGSRLWVGAAVSAVFVLLVLFLLVDLRTSVHEARVLRAGTACAGDTTTDCLAHGQVELGPYSDSVRTRMVSVFVSSPDAEPGDSDLVDLLPADYDDVLDLGDRAVAHRVDGTVVALSRTTGGDRVALAQTGVHAAIVDVSFILSILGVLARGLGTLRECRRAGLGWSDHVVTRLALRRRRADSLMLVGGFSGIVAFYLATLDVRVWVVAALLAAITWWGSAVSRRLRGVGKHAA
jgi:hypothetical protein